MEVWKNIYFILFLFLLFFFYRMRGVNNDIHLFICVSLRAYDKDVCAILLHFNIVVRIIVKRNSGGHHLRLSKYRAVIYHVGTKKYRFVVLLIRLRYNPSLHNGYQRYNFLEAFCMYFVNLLWNGVLLWPRCVCK